MILAGIVLYNPSLERLCENLNNIDKQVDQIVMVDNNSNNNKKIKELISKYKGKILLIENNENLGIAKALNQILEYASNNNFEWFITLDQDSIVKENLIEKYNEFINYENLAMISCEYNDMNAEIKKTNFNNKKFIEVERCITSGTYCNTKALKKCNGFDEKMFIDYVDFDMCTKLIENNYKIIKINYVGMLHEVGKAEIRQILWKKVVLYNHSSLRVYYYVRNGMYYTKKHKKSINILKSYINIIKRVFIILSFENNKRENFKSICKAIKDYRGMKIESIS